MNILHFSRIDKILITFLSNVNVHQINTDFLNDFKEQTPGNVKAFVRMSRVPYWILG